ncbi:MAG: hypothetical protein ACXVIJ_01385 [Thermoanaerobaculia bacterium]
MKRLIAAGFLFLPSLAFPQNSPISSDWTYGARIEIRANYRDSQEERFALRTPFPPAFLPVGQKTGFEETVNSGRHTELSVGNIQLDLGYGKLFAARAKVHGEDKYRRNPTSDDKKIDADELWVRFGEKPEFLERPDGTSLFFQAGKAPKMERQPTRLLESYGLAATAFNRFEDVQLLAGGTVGRNLYWRLQAANGNPFYFRDPNALAGDNGIRALMQPNPDPKLKSGFPILYNAEVEGYFFDTSHVQYGEGLGYRWQRDDQTFGFDALAFHYKRSMADTVKLTGTFYGGDLDLLDGPDVEGLHFGLPIHGDKKEETGGRLYLEWHGLTTTAQFTKQEVAGLGRSGHEVEAGYKIALPFGVLRSIQPAGRWSGLRNDFRAAADKRYPAPSVWWPWTKIDYGVRVGFAGGLDVTVERAKHLIGAPRKLDLSETLVTLRFRSAPQR